MDRGETKDWLHRHLSKLRGEQLAMALLSGTCGVIVTMCATIIGTAVVVAVTSQVFKIGRAWLDWETDLPVNPQTIAMAATCLLFLQAFGFRHRDQEYVFRISQVDWRASENIGLLISFLGALGLDLLHSGPRMINHARRQMEDHGSLNRLNQEICGDVLHLLHCNDHRVSFSHISEFVPGFDAEEHLTQLLKIRGILHLPSEPPGLSLSTDLRKQLGAPTRAQIRASRIPPQPEPVAAEAPKEVEPDAPSEPAPPDEEPPSSTGHTVKPPAFRCTGCKKKFRLRNLQGNVTFSCPRCGETYRTLADSRGRVRIERQSADFDPTADLGISEDGAEDYFQLGLPPSATRQEVKAAYRKLMKEYHPDTTAGLSPVQKKLSEERAREINRAYGKIMDRLGG